MELYDIFHCDQCTNTFNRKANLNRHLKNIHKANVKSQTIRECRIKCILCSIDQVTAMFRNYDDYNKHLKDVHEIKVCLSRKFFECQENFDIWYLEDKRSVNYTFQTCYTLQSGKMVYYNCNRSDSRGFKSECTKNMLKTGASIKLQGTCPSRIIASIKENGHITVEFFETHVGHAEEVRSQRLTKTEQMYLIDQMKQGVSKERIIANARNFNLPEFGLPGRINTINRNDLFNLSRRYNVKNIKRANDLVATATKVEQCNNETVSMEDNRQREMFRERMINFANLICLADVKTYNCK